MRDSQRSKLYAAERASGMFTPEGTWTVEEAQRYVNDLTRSAWFIRRWGGKSITVLPMRGGGRGGFARGNAITLDRWARQEAVVLHEVAHVIAPYGEKHGPKYAGIYLTLVRHKLGRAASANLREQFRQHRVRVSMGGVPKPDDSRWQQIQERRQTAAKAATRPPTPYDRREAATAIRKAVKAGLFGPASGKPRRHALETARRLES